jgi:hypothetical protein
MRLKSGFGAGLDLHRWANVGIGRANRTWVPEQDGLTIGIVVVDDHAAEMAVDSSRAQDRSHEDAELRKKRVMDVVSAGGLDRIELGLSFLPAERLEFFD